MRSILFFVAISAAPAFAQETVTVEGSREWPPAGPVTWSSPGESEWGPHGCADPTCGEAINKPEPGSGPAYLSQQQKDSGNEKNKSKAQEYKEKLKKAAEAALMSFLGLKKYLSGSLQIHDDNVERTVHPDGSVTVKGPCRDLSLHIGAASDKKLPCTEIKGNPEPVKRADGVIENQVRFTFEVYDDCYYHKTCAPKIFTFVAGSERELSDLVWAATGLDI